MQRPFSKLVVAGASRGGFRALREFFAHLPSDFPAPILVACHISPEQSHAPGQPVVQGLPFRWAEDGDALVAGQILFAPPDRHLVVTDGRIRLSAGPKENFSRPAVDPLFRSAAIQYGRDVIGVLLSGDLDDGTVGLQIIKSYGGIAVVQDPEEAEAPSMPKSAMNHVHVDWCLPLDHLAPKLIELTTQGAPTSVLQSVPPIRDLDTLENRFQTRNPPSMDEYMALSQPSVHTCPECNGVLGEIDDRSVLRYRCHTGHAFTASTLADAQQRSTEEALWGAVRALQEKEALLSKLATRADENGRPSQGNEHRRAAQLARTQSESVRNLLIDVRHTTEDAPTALG